jgi:cell division septation protein DedD
VSLYKLKIPVIFLLIATGFSFPTNVYAQDDEKEKGCAIDEVDMGDYCASLPVAVTEAEKKRRRITRFRGTSMMPGKVDSTRPAKPAAPALPSQPGPTPEPAPPEGGFVVQLGAFSTREIAESVVASVSPLGPAIRIMPLQRGDRVLWFCIQGPFESREQAALSRDHIRKEKNFKSAYIKTVDSEIRQGWGNDNIKE